MIRCLTSNDRVRSAPATEPSDDTRALIGRDVRPSPFRTYVYDRGMAMTASTLRQNIYRILDQVIETGEPVIIERNGRRLRIVADDVASRLDALVPRPDVVIGDSDDFVHLDWSEEWSG